MGHHGMMPPILYAAIAKVGLYGQEKDVNINSRQMVKLQKKLETAAYQHAGALGVRLPWRQVGTRTQDPFGIPVFATMASHQP